MERNNASNQSVLWMSNTRTNNVGAGESGEEVSTLPQTGWRIFATLALVICVSIGGLIVWGIIALSNTIEPDQVQATISPDGKWMVEVLDISGGAGGHSGYSVIAREEGSGYSTEVLRLDPLRDYNPTWEGNDCLTAVWESNVSLLLGGIRVTLPTRP